MPFGPSAVLAALHFREPELKGVRSIGAETHGETLSWCDREGLTLLLREVLPQETEDAAAKNVVRVCRAEETYRRLAALLPDAIALKGLTHCTLFGIPPERRAQYDIDLLLAPDGVERARDILLGQGYETIAGMEKFPTDHLPGLFPRTEWRWRGDYFDPDMPLAVELHFRLWNARFQRLPAAGIEDFWARRTLAEVGGARMFVLAPVDAVGYAALHLLKHILHGSGRVFHTYEIASFLEANAGNRAFWEEWQNLHSAELRRLETVAFLIAEAWFGCALPAAVAEEAAALPRSTRAWFSAFATSPAACQFRANKDELWLHLSLLQSWRDRAHITRRRLLPLNLPPPARATETESSRTVYARWFAQRLRHHAASLAAAAHGAIRWRRSIKAL